MHRVSSVDEVLASIDDHLSRGELSEAVRLLVFNAEQLPLTGLAARLDRAATAAGFDDLVQAARSVGADPDNPNNLFQLGYACVERGIGPVAIPVLSAALAQAPGELVIIDELVAAYEDAYRYADAVALLEEHEHVLRDWPERYLLAFHAIMSGDLAKARHWVERLAPPDETWQPARQRIVGMLERADRVGALDARALRPWHFVLNASVLATLSPYGFDEGMNGRYAFLQDTPANCAQTLLRVRPFIGPASSVTLLPDRSSHILGLAASRLLDLPAQPWPADVRDSIVVAYNMTNVDLDILSALRNRRPGSILVEHASCWTSPPPVAADFVGLLHQTVIEPWGEQLIAPPGEDVRRSDADDRPAEEVADEIVAAATALDPETLPDDTPEHLATFVHGLGDAWPAAGPRDRMWSPGPVPSARFV